MTLDLSRREAALMLAAAPLTAAVPARAQSAGLKIGIASRHLQFLPIEDAVAAAKDMGFDAIEWAVRAGAHIEPARVAQDLPRAVELSRKAGLTIEMITTMIQDAQTPYVEEMLRTASALGVRHYRGSAYYRYDYTRPPEPQIAALRPRMQSLVALNRRHDTVFCYHTHSGRGMIGGNVWDIWTAMRDLDPSIGLNFDSGHTTIRTGSGWMDAARIARPYVQALALKDFQWIRGANGKYVAEFCPIGEGLVDFDQYFSFFRDTGFRGPVNIQYEHHDLLGQDFGKWKPAMPKTEMMRLMRADLEFIRARMKAANLI
jgi:sugar phosphate isomerase/epimerase